MEMRDVVGMEKETWMGVGLRGWGVCWVCVYKCVWGG